MKSPEPAGRGAARPDQRPLVARRKTSLKLKLAACLLRLRCELCGEPFEAFGDAVEWDHEVALALGGEHAPANIRPLHARCHLGKSAADARLLAKIERQAGRTGQQARRKKRNAIAGGGRSAGRKRTLQSRGFLTNRSGPLKKGLDGSVERRDRK